jgi:lipooligosaccharide transport system permease protein
MKEPILSVWGAYSVWHRHLRAYVKTWQSNCLPPLMEPIVYLFAFGLGLSPVIRELTYHGVKVSYLEFIGPGMVGIGIISQAFFEGTYGTYIRIRYQRTWHALLAGPLSFFDVFVGELCWAASKGMLGGVLTGLVAWSFGVYPLKAFFQALPLIVLASFLFAALGIFTAGIIRSIDQINVPTFLFIIPMMVISGTYFPRDGLPQTLKFFVDLLPLSALVDLLRWHLAPPEYPVASILWLIFWASAFGVLAALKIKGRVIA